MSELVLTHSFAIPCGNQSHKRPLFFEDDDDDAVTGFFHPIRPTILKIISFSWLRTPYRLSIRIKSTVCHRPFHQFMNGCFNCSAVKHSVALVKSRVQLNFLSPFTCWVSVTCFVSASTLNFIGSNFLRTIPSQLWKNCHPSSEYKQYFLLRDLIYGYRGLLGRGSTIYETLAGRISSRLPKELNLGWHYLFCNHELRKT